MTSPDLLARITWLISTAGLIFRVPELPERGTATSCSFPEQSNHLKRGAVMYGYFVSSGYRGFVDGTWMLFPTESEYYEYMKELEN